MLEQRGQALVRARIRGATVVPTRVDRLPSARVRTGFAVKPAATAPGSGTRNRHSR